MHISVLFDEAIKALNIKEDGVYIDATLGRAGHTQAILKELTKGTLIGFDKDLEALPYASYWGTSPVSQKLIQHLLT